MFLPILLVLPALVLSQCAYNSDVYDSVGDRCYHYSNSILMDGDDAKTYCSNLGYTLASIHSYRQNMFIANNAPPFSDQCFYGNGYCTAIVGGHRDRNVDSFAWWDGEPIFDILVLNTTNGEWSTTNEYNAINDVVCEGPSQASSTGASGPTYKTYTSNPEPSACTMCPTGWTYYDGQNSCYSTLLASNWNSADFLCEEMGGRLTSIHNYGENAFVARLAQTGMDATSPEQQTWIGLNYESGFWRWSDGSRVDFINWAPREPVDTSTKQCVTISQDSSEQSWQTVECDTRMRMFVCKKPTNGVHP